MNRPYRRQAHLERVEGKKPRPWTGFEAVVPNPKLKLMDQVREVMRLRHYSIHAERSYYDWIKVSRVGLTKRASSHTFRHSFAKHALQRGADIRTAQELPGHEDVSTTMFYTHMLRTGGSGMKSPLDCL